MFSVPNRIYTAIAFVAVLPACAVSFGSGFTTCIPFCVGFGSTGETYRLVRPEQFRKLSAQNLKGQIKFNMKFDRTIKGDVVNFFTRYQENRQDTRLVEKARELSVPGFNAATSFFKANVELGLIPEPKLLQMKAIVTKETAVKGIEAPSQFENIKPLIVNPGNAEEYTWSIFSELVAYYLQTKEDELQIDLMVDLRIDQKQSNGAFVRLPHDQVNQSEFKRVLEAFSKVIIDHYKRHFDAQPNINLIVQ